MSLPLLAGAARVAQPVPEPRMEMMGWGRPDGRCTTLSEPLQARALVLEQGGFVLVVVLLELCFPAFALREAMLKHLQHVIPEAGLGEHNLLLLANHTHAGPGGYTHDLFYTLNNPGFCATTHAAIVDAAVTAARRAWERRSPARAWLHQGQSDPTDPVAHNRSPEAYARNRSRLPPVDRTAHVLRVDHLDGTPLALLDWFAVHCTSVHADQCTVHPDNKGMAARFVERHAREAWGAPDFVALFAQPSSGDISPNWRRSRERGVTIGRHDDDLESAAWSGSVQGRLAQRIFDAAPDRGIPLEGAPLDARILWLDLDGMDVLPRFADGRPRRTGSALVGLGFLEGTREGPGPLLPLAWPRTAVARLLGLMMGPERPHGNKLPFTEAGRGRWGRAFGLFHQGRGRLPQIDDVVRTVVKLRELGGLGDEPWLPNRLPVFIWRLGPLAVVNLPVEPTTHAGRLVAHTARQSLVESGVEHVVIGGYANSFAGYATTAPEYRLQRYEGGHTLHGQWTTAAYRTGVAALGRVLAVPAVERPVHAGPRPRLLPPEVLAARAFPVPLG